MIDLHLYIEGGDKVVDQDINSFFNEIYDRTFKNTIRYITAKCSNVDDIHEIVQEVYADVYSTLVNKGVGYIKNPEAFIAKVTKSKVYRHYSLLERIRGVVISNENGVDDYGVETLETYTIEEEVINKQMVDDVFEHLSKKTDDVKRIFYLFYYVDMTIEEIANDLDISVSNVKNKLYRTVRELRTIYGKGE
ncbi:MAG: RNA polymerase sigma factor [Clostridia bacterium]|jgi:RNA polymerase sigma-70 factor (ECF subfamily)